VPGRLGTAHPNIVPYQAFATADGHIMIAVGNDRQFADCMRVCGLPDLAGDPRFRHNADRLANRGALVILMTEALERAPTDYWIGMLRDADVACSPISNIGEVFSSDYARDCGLVRGMRHPYDPELPTVANPVRFSAASISYRSAPPLLGQHSGEVLADWLGYSQAKVTKLRKAGTI
jgi:crotonobetainyl-CoA:carnitine CoA-transferase CaiB-like acyl-CoA transferase